MQYFQTEPRPNGTLLGMHLNYPNPARIGRCSACHCAHPPIQYIEAGRRIDAHLLGMASGRGFSCRAPETASGLQSLRAKSQRGGSKVNNYFINCSHSFLFKPAMALNMNPVFEQDPTFPFYGSAEERAAFILPRFLGQMTRKAEFFASFFIPMRNGRYCRNHERIVEQQT